MVTIYPAKRHRTVMLAEVTNQALAVLQETLQKLEADQHSTTLERVTLEALQAALNRNSDGCHRASPMN